MIIVKSDSPEVGQTEDEREVDLSDPEEGIGSRKIFESSDRPSTWEGLSVPSRFLVLPFSVVPGLSTTSTHLFLPCVLIFETRKHFVSRLRPPLILLSETNTYRVEGGYSFGLPTDSSRFFDASPVPVVGPGFRFFFFFRSTEVLLCKGGEGVRITTLCSQLTLLFQGRTRLYENLKKGRDRVVGSSISMRVVHLFLSFSFCSVRGLR